MKHIKPYRRFEEGDHVILKDKPNNIFLVIDTKDAVLSNDFYWVNIADVNNNIKYQVVNKSLKLAKDYEVNANKYNI